ncbi:putative PAS/PAC sensor protein [Methanoculleus bourgensis MS2]|uniref:PAS/PAC sensor protein n=1 Tax=Methanoculleus bourgensis (strain ATCC 43281 / DSM 3045 / OCM 15 / MS2) TaxID=1201294 RepID=I7KDL3_METBM|nr:PAS domain S-box protein [Methanoculleus bourgensis]CCJ36986.1 putative PAS/PAC sensor protein [Methanoculleus bourgensis MS2]
MPDFYDPRSRLPSLQDQTRMPTPDFSTTPLGDESGVPAELADETVPYGIWICGPDGGVLYLSDSYLDLAGMTLEECRGTGWASNIHPEERAAALAAWEHTVATGETWSRDYRILGSDGEYHTIASRGVPIRDVAGQVILWAGINLDITGRERLQGLVKEFRTLYAISRLIGEGDAGVEEVFRRTADLLPGGFQNPGRVSIRVVPGTAAPGGGRITVPIIAGRRTVGHLVVETDNPVRQQERDLVAAAAAMLGAAVGQAEANAATTASERQYRLLFDQMLDVGLLLEVIRGGSGEPAGFRVIQINRKAEEALGRRRDEVAGEDLVTAVPSVGPVTLDLCRGVARTGTPVHREVYSPDVDAYYELRAYRPEYDRLVVIINDITDRRRAEEKLRMQRSDLDNRVRELATLYAMTGIVERPGITLDAILQEVATVLPAGWLHPEDAVARITLDDREYLSAGFCETSWRQESPIIVHGRTAGRVEVCYLHEHPRADEGSFLTEERSLIDTVAERLGRTIERMRADEGLRRSEEKYRLLFEQMLESYTLYEVVRDNEGSPVDYRLLELNEKAADLFGRSREELVGRRLFDVFPAIREGAGALYGEVAETGVPVQRRLQEPGSGRWYELHIYQPQPGRLAVIGQDITEQKKAERALRESEERFRGIFEQAGAGIALIDPGGRITETNPAFVRMFGYDEDELHAMLFPDLIFSPDRENAGALPRESVQREMRYVTKDGRTIWGRLTTSLLHDPGERGFVIGMVEDITDWREMQNALRESEERFREIAQRSFDMIYTCYADRGITYISPAVMRILGYTPEEMIGVQCRDYVLDESWSAWLEARIRVARGEPVEGLLVELRRKDGTAAFVEMNESPIIENGEVVGVQVVGRDVSDRKRYEDLRLQAFYQIEQNIEQFAILADHIRLPLQVILGTADLIDDGGASAKIRRQVDRINGIVKQLDEGWVESRKIREFLRRNELV